MADKKYANYTVEQLLDDQEFVSLVLSKRSDDEWTEFLETHPQAKSKLNQARKLIQLFKVNTGTAAKDRKFKLWKEISEFNETTKMHSNIRYLKHFTRIAASILIIIAIGTLAYLSTLNSTVEYQFAVNNTATQSEYPILILSNDEHIELKDEQVEIRILGDKNAFVVNDKRLIKLASAGTESSQLNELIVPFGKKASVILDDGSRIWLNAGSRFAFPKTFVESKRTVFLEGEGYFEVARNEDHAFMVSTPSIDVEVLGTKFNLSAYESDSYCETVLLEGKVNVSGKDKFFNDEFIMAPNQQVVYDKTNEQLSLNKIDNAEIHTSWVHGWYQFSNEDLKQVLTKLERYYNVTFSYDREKIAKTLPITGKLDLNKSLEEEIFILSTVANFKYKIANKNLIIIE